MDILKQGSLKARRDFALSFIEKDGGVYLEVGDKTIGLERIWDDIKRLYPEHLRGAIVYSRPQLVGNVRKTSAVLSKYFERYKIYWAVKSAPILEIAKVMASEGIGFDVGSYEELKVAMDAGADPRKICHTAPGKYDWDIDAIVDCGCISISDNLDELQFLNRRASDKGMRVEVGIRINPSIEPKTQDTVATGTLNCKFGIPDVSSGFLGELKKFSSLDVRTLHMHIGTQISDPTNYVEAVSSMVRAYDRFKDAGFDIDTIDVGGGFPFGYTDNPDGEAAGWDHAFMNNISGDFESYISHIHGVMRDRIKGRMPRFAMEPGRHLTAGAGFALGYVLNKKLYPNGIRWLISSITVNDIWHKVVVPSYYMDIHILNSKSKGGRVPTAIGGTLCFSGDVMTPWDRALDLQGNIERGDMILITNVGAYPTIGSGNFHNIPRLPVFMVDEDVNLKEIKAAC